MSSQVSRIEEWNTRFALPGVASVVVGQGGLPMVRITAPAASAEIYLHGAQVTSWRPAGAEEVLFLSADSRWEDGRAIRGGIPICFPWFRGKQDDVTAPAHGVVRTRSWELVEMAQEGEAVLVAFVAGSDEASRRWFPHEFHVEHRVTVGTELRLALVVTNTGTSPFAFEEALHAYLRVGDVAGVRVAGLGGTRYLDNMDGNREKLQQGDVIIEQATDNAYLATEAALELHDAELRRRVRTRKDGSSTTVVWNPWEQGAASLADLGHDEWRRMACVEASNILSGAITLGPGEQHTMRATLEVAGL